MPDRLAATLVDRLRRIARPGDDWAVIPGRPVVPLPAPSKQ
jgi:hypothetical protein